jgi:hypothetical protein
MQKLMIGTAVCCAMSIAPLSSSQSRQRQLPVPSVSLYEGVVERLFSYSSDRKTPWQILIRHTRTDIGEIQFLIRLSASGYEVERWQPSPGAGTIEEQLARLLENSPAITADAAAGQIKIDRARGRIPTRAAIGRLLRRMESLKVSVAASDQLFIHGSEYRLTLESIGRDVTVILQGPQDGLQSSDELIRWIAEVRAGLESLELPERVR